MNSVVLVEEDKDNNKNNNQNNKINKIKNYKVELILSLIAAYGINLALCSDLNIDFGNNQKIVDNPVFQFILFYASAYIITEDYKYSLVLPIIYFIFK